MSAGLDAEQIEMWEYWHPEEPNKVDTSKLPISRLPAIFAETMSQEPDPDLYAKLIKEEYHEFMDEEWGTVGELKELADLVYVIYGYAHGNGWDLDEAIRRVHDNNIGRCIQPDGSIKRREDGKIIKNKDYPTVNLTDLV